jgi:hypothetical protein
VTLQGGIEPRTRRLDDEGRIKTGIEASVFREGRFTPTFDFFVNDAIIIDEAWGDRVTFGVEEGPCVDLVADGLPMLGLWTRPGAPFLCLEPWRGMPAIAAAGPDAIETRPGVMHIAPAASSAVGMTIVVTPATRGVRGCS